MWINAIVTYLCARERESESSIIGIEADLLEREYLLWVSESWEGRENTYAEGVMGKGLFFSRHVLDEIRRSELAAKDACLLCETFVRMSRQIFRSVVSVEVEKCVMCERGT